MRLFAGLDLPEKVTNNIGSLIDQLRPTAPLRWSPAKNLHITTKFIGEWPEERLTEIKTVLASVRGAPIDIAIRGLGWFPNPHSPRVFFAPVRAAEGLKKLAADTDAATHLLGVEKERRDYSPHLTLARIEERTNLAELRRAVAALPSDEFGAFTAAEFHLYWSQTKPGGSIYTKLATFSLGDPS